MTLPAQASVPLVDCSLQAISQFSHILIIMAAVGRIGTDELAAVAVGWTVCELVRRLQPRHACGSPFSKAIALLCSGLTLSEVSALVLLAHTTLLAAKLLELATR